jgi:DNA-binding CsgD family transcriptional regulator
MTYFTSKSRRWSWRWRIDFRTHVLYNQTMELWDRFLTLFRMLRGNGLRRYELQESLQAALVERADREQRPPEELQDELLAAGLAQHDNSEQLKQCWERLSAREKDVAALSCLEYTNRQIALMMGISPETVKSYAQNVFFKFNLHSKNELRMKLEEWDFSEWGPHAQI